MAESRHITVDGNEAAARIAHRVSEVIAIYPITPASPMGEHADAWSEAGVENLWGAVPDVIEMQSEGGRRRGGPRVTPGWCPHDDLHRIAGTSSDDPQPLQDRR